MIASLAPWRDGLARRRGRWLDALGLGGRRARWFRELDRLTRGGMAWEEFWVRYTLGRIEAAGAWGRASRETEADRRRFYTERDYWLYRQVYYHRHDTYRTVLATMRGPVGRLCEYGAGVAPVTAWLRPRRPRWRYTVVDLAGAPTLAYAQRRFGADANVEFRSPGLDGALPLVGLYEVITIFEVLEHLANAGAVVRHLVEHLAPGGTLHLDWGGGAVAKDENLAESAAQRPATLLWLWATMASPAPLDPDSSSSRRAQYTRPAGVPIP